MPKKPAHTRDRVIGPPDCAPDWGINWHPGSDARKSELRAQVGEIAEDLPAADRPALLAAGLIEEA